MNPIELGILTVKEFVKQANKERLSNKNIWHCVGATVNGRRVTMKYYNTWIQIMNIDSRKTFSPMEIKVGEFKTFITEALA